MKATNTISAYNNTVSNQDMSHHFTGNVLALRRRNKTGLNLVEMRFLSGKVGFLVNWKMNVAPTGCRGRYRSRPLEWQCLVACVEVVKTGQWRMSCRCCSCRTSSLMARRCDDPGRMA